LPAGRNQPNDLLIVGGEDHKTGQAHNQHNCWTRLAEWAKSQFPMMGSVEYRWSGQVFETADGLGLIGAVPGKNNMYVITGDSGLGLPRVGPLLNRR
jgi:glycine/D-amino acid oxidase-like deaminating enzyme